MLFATWHVCHSLCKTCSCTGASSLATFQSENRFYWQTVETCKIVQSCVVDKPFVQMAGRLFQGLGNVHKLEPRANFDLILYRENSISIQSDATIR